MGNKQRSALSQATPADHLHVFRAAGYHSVAQLGDRPKALRVAEDIGALSARGESEFVSAAASIGSSSHTLCHGSGPKPVDGQKSQLTALSIFSGAGGMDLGFAQAGFDIKLAIEVNDDACATYRLNFGHRMLRADLNTLSVSTQIKNVDMVFGGPPCQGFSVAGAMDPEDRRSLLIHRFFDIVDELTPKAFVCENVDGLALHKRWRNVRDGLIARAAVNYDITLFVLNAVDFGVPQNRHRMFLVGVRKDIGIGQGRALFDRIATGITKYERVAPTVGDIVRQFGPAGSKMNPNTCPAKITFLKKPVLRASAYAGMIFNGGGRPLSPIGWSSTLPATMGGNRTPVVDEDEIFNGTPGFVEEYHRHLITGGKPRAGKVPKRLRRLTINECKTIQGFPTDFQFAGSKSSVYRQIGNAVPPPLARAVAGCVFAILEEYTSRGQLEAAA